MEEISIDGKKYKLEKILGEGGYGKVFLATHGEEKFAIKKIMIEDNENDIDRETILVEKLNRECPNYFTKYLGRTKSLGYYYILSEYFEGYTLQNFMNCQRETGFTLTIDQFLTFAKFLFTALECLHRNGLAHTDLNAGNIMFNKKEMKIIDFGLMCVPGNREIYDCYKRFSFWGTYRDQFGKMLSEKKNFPFENDVIYDYLTLFEIGFMGNGKEFYREIGGMHNIVSAKKLDYYYSKYVSDHKDDKRAVKIVKWMKNIQGHQNYFHFVVPKYSAKKALDELNKIPGKSKDLY